MRIRQIKIRNFRSIKDLTIQPSGLCVLVGENGAGKTNILAALDFLMGERWPATRYLNVSDYYNHEQNRPVFIRVEFAENEHNIRFLCFDQAQEKGETRYGVFGRDYRGVGDLHFASNEIREKCALVYLEAERDFERQMGTSPWNLFGRIIKLFDTAFPPERKLPLEERFDETLSLLRTEEFDRFERELSDAFADQLKRTTHRLGIKFRAFDPHSYYRSLQPIFERREGDELKPSEAGQGMRNLVLLAMFRAYARVFKSDAIIAIEEPEIYLHPHAQRSLYNLFVELADQGNQVLYSTHSASFVDIEHFDQICVVERCQDEEGDLSTKVRQVDAGEMLKNRQVLHPAIPMSEESVKRRYHSMCSHEHSEAFFATKIVLVEGETEQHALPIYAEHLGYQLDSHGVSVVNAHGKTNLDTLYQLYSAFEIPVYLIFDNDVGGKNTKDFEWNKVLLRMLDLPEELEPGGGVMATHAILEGNFENEMQRAIGSKKYKQLDAEASSDLGSKAGKGLKARFMAQRLVEENLVPEFISRIIQAIRFLNEYSFDLEGKTALALPTTQSDSFMREGRWFCDDEEWCHGEPVDAVRHLGCHVTVVGEVTSDLFLVKKGCGSVVITGILMLEHDSITEEHAIMLGYSDLKSCQDELGKMGDRFWFMEFKRVN